MPLSPKSIHVIHAQNAQRRLIQTVINQDAVMQDALQKSASRIKRLISQLPSEGVGAQVRAAQYQIMRQQMYAEAEQLWGKDIANTIVGNIGTATQMAINSNQFLLQILSKSVPDSQALAADALMRSAKDTFAALRARLTNSIDLSPNVYKNKALMTGKIDDIVNTAILSGSSSSEIANAVEQYIIPQVMGGPSYAAKRLGRTELNNAYRSAAVQSYHESPYVTAVQFVISGSHTGEDECDDLADADDYGLGPGVYPTDEVPDEPHPNGMCYDIPIGPSPEEFSQSLLNGEYDCVG